MSSVGEEGSEVVMVLSVEEARKVLSLARRRSASWVLIRVPIKTSQWMKYG